MHDMNGISEKSQAAFTNVLAIVNGKIVNAILSHPIMDSNNVDDTMSKYYERLDHMQHNRLSIKKLAARHWFWLALSMCAILIESANEKPNYFKVPLFLALFLFVGFNYHRFFGHAPFEARGQHFLNDQDAKQMDLELKSRQVLIQRERAGLLGYFGWFSGLNRGYDTSGLMHFEHEGMISALFAVKRGAFDCIAISGMVILMLGKQGITENVERFYKTGYDVRDPHSYIVVNRTAGTSNDISSWNDDSKFIDPWYGICMTAKEIKEKPDFFLQYPLLNPIGKSVTKIPAAFYKSQYYSDFSKKLDALIAQSQTAPSKRTYWKWLEGDMIFPRIGKPKEQSIQDSMISNHLKQV